MTGMAKRKTGRLTRNNQLNAVNSTKEARISNTIATTNMPRNNWIACVPRKMRSTR